MLKKISTFIIFTIFITSICLLTLQIFPDVFKSVSSGETNGEQDKYSKVLEVPLGAVRPIDDKQMGAPSASLAMSTNGELFALGSENGDLIICSSAGKILWQEKVGLGKISFTYFINEGKELLVGESSPDGRLRCLDSQTGAEIWNLDSSRDLGNNLAQKIYPTFISAVQNSTTKEILALAQIYAFNEDGSRRYYNRVYHFSKEGKLLGKFPRLQNIDVWVGTLNVDSKRNRLILGAGSFYPVDNLKFNDNIYVINIPTGEISWSLKLDVVEPYKTATTRYAPVLSQDQNSMAFLANDGRAFLCRYNGELLWKRAISTPVKIGGTYLNSTALDALINEERILFFTSNTYNRTNWQLPTPVEHPSSNSVFIFNYDGTLISRYSAKGTIGNMVGGRNIVGLSVGINLRKRDQSAHGVVLLEAKTGSELSLLRTEGPCIKLIADNKFQNIIAIEAPMKTREGNIVGEYKLHFWQLKNSAREDKR